MEAVQVYQPDMQEAISNMFPLKVDANYEIKGEQVDWAKYHYYKVPLIGVISELSNIQVSIRNSEMQALIYMISQSDASDPPSGSRGARLGVAKPSCLVRLKPGFTLNSGFFYGNGLGYELVRISILKSCRQVNFELKDKV
jgi:GldM N-terminal domain.